MECSLNNTLSQRFNLGSDADIAEFVVEKKRDFFDHIKVTFIRLGHFFQTGIWIDESQIFDWVSKNPSKIDSSILKSTAIYNKILRIQNHLFVPAKTPFQKMVEAIKFIGQLIFSNGVGAILPSSDALGKAILKEISKSDLTDPNSKRRVMLEVGPGTGVFTDKIIKKMGQNDRLVLVEYNQEFCEILKEKYKEIQNVEVIQGDINEYVPDEKFDHIVSGLPLNSFKADFVKGVLDKYESWSKEGTTISYFEYMFPKEVSVWFSSDRNNLEMILKTKDEFFKKHPIRVDRVYANIPPAKVRHHKIA